MENIPFGIEKKISDWSKGEYKKQLSEEGFDEEATKRIVRNLEAVEEEQARYASFDSEFTEASYRGFALFEKEISRLAAAGLEK